MAAWTSSQAEEVDFFNYKEMLAKDAEVVAWKNDDEIETVE